MKDYNVMFDREKFFWSASLRIYDSILKIATGQGDDWTAGCLLDYNYFKGYNKMTAINLNKQQALDADPQAIQQINLTGNLERDRNEDTTMFFIVEEAKKFVLDFSQGTAKVIDFFFFNIKWLNIALWT